MNFRFLFTHYLPFLQGSAVLETKSDSDILAEYQEDEFNKLYNHEVCWDMDKRGGVAETPFHLLYLVSTPIHLEVAKILMKHFPKMALDCYEGEEYYGKLKAYDWRVTLGQWPSGQWHSCQIEEKIQDTKRAISSH
jgi:hypothetical protein